MPGPVIAAFWGPATDYGAVRGDFDTLTALATLAHDCLIRINAADFATRLGGAPKVDRGNPGAGLSAEPMQQLQRVLAARGHDVGNIDGILGEKTRAAVRSGQQRPGLPADAWPTPDLLARLR